MKYLQKRETCMILYCNNLNTPYTHTYGTIYSTNLLVGLSNCGVMVQVIQVVQVVQVEVESELVWKIEGIR